MIFKYSRERETVKLERKRKKNQTMNHPPNNDNVIDNAANDAGAPAIAEVVVVGANNDVAVVAGADAAAANEDQDDQDAAVVDVATLDILPPAERERIYQEAMTLLQNRFNLPSRLRDRTMVQFAQQFINNVKEDIHKTISVWSTRVTMD